MSKYFTYKEILGKAYECRNSVHSNQKLGVAVAWSYYFAKSILNPKKNIDKFSFTKTPTPHKGDHISRQIPKTHYLQLCRNHIKLIEEKKRMPSWNAYKGLKINEKLFCYVLACIVIWQYQKNELPKEANINSKIFTKPTETHNEVYDYATKKYGVKFKTLDDILNYVANHFNYEGYLDDYKSNKQVTDTKAGNCTDLLQWLCNMVEAIGYTWKCIHVECRQSGTGHVFGKFKHPQNTNNEWITRDIACIADNGSFCVWCGDGYKLAENPDWWLENLHR